LLKILQVIFSVATLVFVIYGLFTGNFDFQPLMIFFLGLTMLIMGLRELQQKRKISGGLLIVVFLFLLFVSIQSVLLN
jgi:hypothetical protein